MKRNPVYNQNPYRVSYEALEEIADDMRLVAEYIENVLEAGMTIQPHTVNTIRRRWGLVKRHLGIPNGGK